MCALAAAAIVAAAAAAPFDPLLRAQTPPFDPIADVAVKAAAILASSDHASVAVEAADPSLGAAIVAQMRARGVAVDSAAPVTVHATCGRNLRDRGCLAEIVSGGVEQVVSALQPREDAEIDAPAVALELEPLLAQREPMLDVAIINDLLVVLEAHQVTVHPRRDMSGDVAPPAASAPLPGDRRWPRDMRGRLQATHAGFDVFLPAVSCRGRLAPLSVACSDSDAAWPLGLDNTGMVGNRNYFVTPEGFAFYGAAPLGDGRPGRWLVADRDGVLTVLDARRSALRRDDLADDVVRLAEPCADGVHVVAAGRARDGSPGDELRLIRIGDAALTPIAVWRVAGTVTALWAEQGDRAARTIVRSPTRSRYEAFRVTVACAR